MALAAVLELCLAGEKLQLPEISLQWRCLYWCYCAWAEHKTKTCINCSYLAAHTPGIISPSEGSEMLAFGRMSNYTLRKNERKNASPPWIKLNKSKPHVTSLGHISGLWYYVSPCHDTSSHSQCMTSHWSPRVQVATPTKFNVFGSLKCVIVAAGSFTFCATEQPHAPRKSYCEEAKEQRLKTCKSPSLMAS